MSSWTAGNAETDAADRRGWLVGSFLPATAGVRASADVEIKWAHHPQGDTRTEWTSDDKRTTIIFLISGAFKIDLTEGGSTMTRQGDYVMWGPGIDHSWTALEESVVVTIRWPSDAGSD